jgi:hypothetical protein
MSFPVASGRPNYSGNFIPEIWSGKLIQNFYDATVLSAIANTDYEGEIRRMGDTVNIRTTPEITIKTYVKGQTLTVENPDKPKIQLVIDKGEYFACIEDDVDKVQSDINLMDTWSKDASERMKIKIDQRVLTAIIADVAAANEGSSAGRISGSIDLGAGGAGTAVTLSKTNVLEYIVDMGTVLDEANVPESGRWIVIPAKMAGLIKKSDLKDASLTGDGTSPLRNGRIGMIDRFTVYMSHNLPSTGSGSTREFDVIAGHKMGFTFASQMTEMETIRSESTFGNIVRGLQVYGFQTVKPEALAHGVVIVG